MNSAVETTAAGADAHFAQPRGKLALWTGVLGGPVAWALQLQAGYTIVRFTCSRQWLTAAHHAVTLAMLLVALACTVIAAREWVRAGREASAGAEGGAGGRSRFLGALGVLTSGLFSLTIVAAWVPLFFLSPCWY